MPLFFGMVFNPPGVRAAIESKNPAIAVIVQPPMYGNFSYNVPSGIASSNILFFRLFLPSEMRLEIAAAVRTQGTIRQLLIDNQICDSTKTYAAGETVIKRKTATVSLC